MVAHTVFIFKHLGNDTVFVILLLYTITYHFKSNMQLKCMFYFKNLKITIAMTILESHTCIYIVPHF